jgi:hypothetical protein
MGRQVGFVVSREGLWPFAEFVSASGDICFFESIHHEEKLSELDGLLPLSPERFMTVFLARREDVSLIKSSFVEQQGYWSIDSLTSPVVEFSLPYERDTGAVRPWPSGGRLWFSTGWWGEFDEWATQPTGFVDWADSLLRWIRRHFVRGDHGLYAPRA